MRGPPGLLLTAAAASHVYLWSHTCRQVDPQSQAAMWQQAFFKLAAAAGVPVDPGQGQAPPEAVIAQAQAARQRDPGVQVGVLCCAPFVSALVCSLTALSAHMCALRAGWGCATSATCTRYK